MGEPASKWFFFDAEGTADLMSGLRADLADLDYVTSAFLLFATGVLGIPAILERLGAIRPLLVRNERMERALVMNYSAPCHHSGNARGQESYRERAHFSNGLSPPSPFGVRPVRPPFWCPTGPTPLLSIKGIPI